ncbi:MAG: tRNA (adenosine(37)-N6)-threonylcarbamoyltransferase complex dimerization subunit type 1 TsaB [Deltaproteobacteria bacterium]|nr:tRNA (adenosine(37)-N6)-threonylcarbamoyltransferase complex dimerization subunit type 1 TsaB [Deltaproteobacteria bacterium]
MAHHGITTQRHPIILSLENSGMCGSIALTARDLCLAEYSLTSKITHSKRLLGSIDFIMRESLLDWPDIDAIAISLGPGSFTGLRIGLATAKGLAMATGRRLIGIPSLEALACQIQYTNRLICPVIDARKKEVYTAIYRHQYQNLQVLAPPMAVSPRDLADQIREPVVFIGDGSVLYRDVLAEALGDLASFAEPAVYFPRAAAIGRLALPKWQASDFLNPVSAVPTYIRPSDAEMMADKKSTG